MQAAAAVANDDAELDAYAAIVVTAITDADDG